jgi:hypothetical protein
MAEARANDHATPLGLESDWGEYYHYKPDGPTGLGAKGHEYYLLAGVIISAYIQLTTPLLIMYETKRFLHISRANPFVYFVLVPSPVLSLVEALSRCFRG